MASEFSDSMSRSVPEAIGVAPRVAMMTQVGKVVEAVASDPGGHGGSRT